VKKLLLLSALFVFACSNIEIKDVTITINPYSKNDRGKYWDICIDSYNVDAFNQPIAYFQILSRDGQEKEFEIDFIHLKEECNKKNILVHFAGRHTPIEEFKWLKYLEADDIEYLNVRIKQNYSDSEFVFQKRFLSKDLKK